LPRTGPGSDVRSMLQQYGQKDESRSYSSKIVHVSLQKLKEFIAKHSVPSASSTNNPKGNEEKTLDEKEMDIEYQRRRLKVFRELLHQYPESTSQIVKVTRSLTAFR